MKYLTQNKWWDITEEYNIDKILYLLSDRSNENTHSFDFFWKNNRKQHHREHGLPTSIWSDGDLYWRKNGVFHREGNKPAIIYNNGHKRYYIYIWQISKIELV